MHPTAKYGSAVLTLDPMTDTSLRDGSHAAPPFTNEHVRDIVRADAGCR
jgi:hypothetical protein